MPEEYLEIRGARVHNLKNIDLRVPHNRLVVVTGVSGSGKSSLVFDVIFAEGRRRYVESLSSYARQFLERIERPDVDEVLGISPTVAIRQRNMTKNPRSTVGTVTEIYDYLRLLFARVGRTYCADCGENVRGDGVDLVTGEMLSKEAGSRWFALFPVREEDIPLDHPHCEEYPNRLAARLAQLRERGYNRLFQEGAVVEFSTPESLLDIDFDKPLYVLTDRLAIVPDSRERIAEAVEMAYQECREARFQRADPPGESVRYSSEFRCRGCGRLHQVPRPEMLSFNTAEGACGSCKGEGTVVDYAIDLIVSRPDLSLRDGAVQAWQRKHGAYQRRMLTVAEARGIPTDVPYRDLSAEHRAVIEEGCENYGGIRGFIEALKHQAWRPSVASQLWGWKRRLTCPQCKGTRLSDRARNIRVDGRSIEYVLRLSLGAARDFFERLSFEGADAAIAENLLIEIRSRLRYLTDVGLDYLTLDRGAATLSGGEAQRIQLASSLGARLVGVCYVLDEPSIGLHSRDTRRLIRVLHSLRDIGNTVLVVEHDREMMQAADHLVDLGPAAGEHGGEVVFSGRLDQIAAGNGSLTGRYLAGMAAIEVPARRRSPKRRPALTFRGATKHNLKDVSFGIPLRLLTVVTGVSGSGKSTLMHGIVHETLSEGTGGGRHCRAVDGAGHVREVILIDQAQADRNSRSVPATYMGIFDEIRYLFSCTNQARQAGLGMAQFSFNISSGRCPVCDGSGRQTVDMQFLADVDLTCEECGGKRYRPQTLAVTFQSKSIWEVLQLTVDEALRFFAGNKRIVSRLSVLEEVGLGYVRLGQPATQLSGGEAQRMKLAQHIADAMTSDTLFLFDEPTTGLHFDDIKKLLASFDRLLAGGSTVLVIEHNLDVIKCADWIIDLGPEGGDRGGRIVAQGTPERIARCNESITGRYLREVLA